MMPTRWNASLVGSGAACAGAASTPKETIAAAATRDAQRREPTAHRWIIPSAHGNVD